MDKDECTADCQSETKVCFNFTVFRNCSEYFSTALNKGIYIRDMLCVFEQLAGRFVAKYVG